MAREYRYRTEVPSSDGQRMYVVAETVEGEWQCSCVGWIRHFPRRDCKHIRGVRDSTAGHVAVTNSGQVPARRPTPVALTAKTAAKRGADADEASAIGRAKREEVQAKKAAKLGHLRYGFQLAHTYSEGDGDLSRGEWVAEIKYDGELAMWIDGRLVNRSGNDVTHRFPEIRPNTNAVLVGELVVLDERGFSHFNKVQERNTDDPIKIAAAARYNPATFVAFDILEAGGNDLTALPLRQRRRMMKLGVAFGPRVRLIDQLPIGGPADVEVLVNKMRELEQEGVMVKDLDAPYVARRTRNWLKAKTWQEREFDIARFEDTGVGDGFVIYVVNRGREQRITCGSFQMRERIRRGHRRVEIKFLSEGDDGAMRFPSVRRLV